MKRYFIDKLIIFFLIFIACIATQSCFSVTKNLIKQTNNVANKNDDIVFSVQEWIYYLPKGQTQPKKLVKGLTPSFSPDKKEIAYKKTTSTGVSSLMIYNLTSGKSRVIVNPDNIINNPVWSPNSNLIAYIIMIDSGKTQIKIVNASNLKQETVISEGENSKWGSVAMIFEPVWANDGQSIYFQDMHKFHQFSISGKLLSKIPLDEICGDKNSITSADSFVPNPVDQNLIAFTKSVSGTAKFEKVFNEPNTALFVYDKRLKKKKS